MTLDELSFLSKDELVMYIAKLEEKNEKQSRKIFGLEQTIRNLKEKEEKAYDHINGSCNHDTDYVNRYHSRSDR